ncbi:ACT domain-containing protein [Lacimicrobium alkaliphilum]|uniref:DUF2241 domain-containing protein n=1 Tax=Lacimicrobium alkaliphilum TaxID=1526571 RepID=A0ABQ1RE77_9ALTE|nr:ACT domain-containing protein [Lacimicrobium alkaliphilum]GGD67437.1 hypothetical protein GCM10011357_23260 [Lacimicrobium alkaliphilum]
MAAERQLVTLIRQMQPVLDSRTFVFACLGNDGVIPAGLKPQMLFREQEGPTLITELREAQEHGLRYDFVSRMITLNIHSALDAVGFLACITSHLARSDMGVNPVSGFFHDHLFVPADKADLAMQALAELISQQTD